MPGTLKVVTDSNVSGRDLLVPLIRSTRAVAPIVGVILKVAVAIILAAVVLTVVMTILPDTEPGPQASFETVESPEDGVVEFVHVSGDTIALDRIYVAGNGELDRSALGSEVTAGDRIRVTDIVADEGDTVRLAWEDETETESILLTEQELTADHMGIDSPPSGDVEIVDDVDADSDELEVETSNYENMTTAYLVVKNNDTGEEVTFPETEETVVTVSTDDIGGVDGDDEIVAELYATDERTTLLDSDTEQASGGGGGPGFTFATVGLALLLAALLGRREEAGGESSE